MASSSSVSLHTLPLFPLPDVVLFPRTLLPLHIFEPRYRAMIGAALEGDKLFGVLRYDVRRAASADKGCSTRIVEAEKLPDGRLNILTQGERRFAVRRYIQEKPYLVAKVEWLDDEKDDPGRDELAATVRQLVADVAYLTGRLAGKAISLPEDIPTEPEALSFWIAESLHSVAAEQQALLEMVRTSRRLTREAEILTAARNELAARSALKNALG